jgi:hypothetical protein
VSGELVVRPPIERPITPAVAIIGP